MEAIREAAEKQIQLLGALNGQWMRPISTAGNSGEVQGMVRKKEIEEEIRLIKKQKRGLYEDLKEGMLEQETVLVRNSLEEKMGMTEWKLSGSLMCMCKLIKLFCN